MYELDEDGHLIFSGYNPAADEILGVDNSIFLGKSIDEAFPPLADTEIPDRYREAARDGITWRTEQVEYDEGGIKGAFEVVAFQTAPNAMAAIFLDITERKQAAEAREKVQRRFQDLVETLNDWVWEVNDKGIYTYISPRIKDVLGYEPEELLGKTPFSVMSEAEADRVERIFREIVKKRDPIRGLVNIGLHKDGGEVVLETNGQPFDDEHGNYAGYRGIDRDITERTRAEREIQELKEFNEGIVQGVAEALLLEDVDGLITFVNPALIKLLDFAPEDLIGQHWEILVPIDQRDRLRDKTVRKQDSQQSEQYETRLLKADGGEIPVLINAKPLYDGRRYRGALSAVTDISDRLEMENALRESEHRYRTLFERSRDAIFFVDIHSGRFLGANKAAEILTGRTQDELHNLTTADISLEGAQDRLETVRGTDQTLQFENVVYVRPDGTRRFTNLSTIRLDEDTLIGIAHDITDRRAAEETIQKDLREKNALLQEVHHRVKNNLNVITSLLNLQAHQITSRDDALEAFSESRNRIHAMALVHERLYSSEDFSRIDMHAYISQIAHELIDVLGAGATIQLDLNVEELNLDISKAIPCGLILNELITNSLKHAFNETPSGNLQIRFYREDDELILLVKDDGVGLPEDFDLEQVDSLGLHIVKLLSEQVEGEIAISGRSGTEITIRFDAA